MAKRLTALSVAAIKPRAARFEVSDGGCRNLYLITQPSGRKSFAVRYRFNGKPRKLTLDAGLTLAGARAAATKALHELDRGIDPAVAKVAAKAAAAKTAAELAADTVELHAKQFLERYARKRTRESTWRQTEYILTKIVAPAWHGRTIHDIRRRDVIDLVEGVAEGRPVLANRTLAILSRFFGWLCERDVLSASPVHGVKRPSEETARDRVLTDAEIRSLWHACDAVGGAAAACIKVMLLTGQRRGECAGMRRSEIDGDVWSLAPSRTKNARRHDVPLSRQALEIIEAMPHVGDPIFSTDGDKPITNFNRVKIAVDAIMKPEKPFHLHDLRRTCVSNMARLGTPLPTIEKVVNHISGSFRGVVGVYQRHDFAAEKREALQRWANHVEEIVRGEPAGKVVRLGRGA
jgi:integrase